MIGLDTTFLIDLLRKERGAVNLSQQLDNENVLYTTEINVFEVVLGIFSNKQINQKKDLIKARELFAVLSILPLDHKAALEAGRIAGTLIAAGKQIDDNDCIAAAIAKTNGIQTIVTRNEKHFALTGLQVKTY